MAGARRVSFNSSLPASVISRGLANASTLELEGGGRGGLEGGRSGGLESLKGAVRDGRTEQLQREVTGGGVSSKGHGRNWCLYGGL